MPAVCTLVLLYLLSASTTAAASGALFTDAMFGDQSEDRFYRESVRFAIKHYLPLLIWLVPCAEECANVCLGRIAVTIIHFVAGMLPVVMWAVVYTYSQLATDVEASTAYVPSLTDTPALVLAVALSTVAWSCLAFA